MMGTWTISSILLEALNENKHFETKQNVTKIPADNYIQPDIYMYM